MRTVYIGGGTPTTLAPDQLKALLDRLHTAFDLAPGTEFTVEAGRPDTITREKLEAIRDGGGNRISVNPQTMSDLVLETIGRSHRAEDIRQAYALAREVGVGAINMDLIAGLPADTPEGFAATLDEVIGMDPENITVHTLALKKGARLRQENVPLPSGRTWPTCWTLPGPPCGQRGTSPTISTGRNSCPGPLKTWAGASPAGQMRIISA